ncbi:helix-turn-helix domain-containing protein [Rhodovulum strictum]|uniref:Helix-turn-helix domain-containing protein n=1 Tax=Rhodovulum strictum TaxID=58314 RepID=A0A844BES5_9RHOB|nr:helix-turn-helix domain-containing protein [Rhodovulum strictum]MRH21068.1 helix-turn-helix domain-containing protein [Rhodovulum strictum]
MVAPEQIARAKIDSLLSDAGWVLQDRDQVNRNAAVGVAVREFSLPAGACDYLLFIEGKAAGVIEAKKAGVTLSGVADQGGTIKTVINGMTFDGATTDPTQQAVRDALIAFMAATAQAQAEATKEAQRAGIEAAREGRPQAYRGRKPSYSREQMNLVRDMLASGSAGTSEIAKASGLTRQTVLRIKGDMVEAEAALARWGL